MSNYNYIRHLNAFFSLVRSDERLTSTHVSLYLALFQYWNFNRFQNPFSIFRQNIMAMSKIGSKNTYHKSLKHLHNTQYIIYHPPASPFLPVSISMIRLVANHQASSFQQLKLFHFSDECSLRTVSSTPGVPDMVLPGTSSNTVTVPHPVHNKKQNNKKQLSVYTPTQVFQKNKKWNEALNNLLNQNEKTKVEPAPCTSIELQEVEQFFIQHNFPVHEAQSFYYYNQGKNWKLTDQVHIYNWQSLARKWMLNLGRQQKKHDARTEVQHLYLRFLNGENVYKYIQPQYCDELRLPISNEIKQEALTRRMNQLVGSNEYSHYQLLRAYTGQLDQPDLIKQDENSLLTIAKKLTVIKYLQQLKNQNYTCIP